jgi:uncharacterized protein (TIGR03083 family)
MPYRSWLADEGETFAATVDGADPATPVPTCPGWSVADLVAHVGSYHRWVADLLAEAGQEPRAPYALRPGPDDDLAGWYRDGLGALLKAVDATDPDTPMWTVTVDQRAGAWARRQAHDLTVHRWDAQHALGSVPGAAEPIEAVRAADFLDELFIVALPYILPFLGRPVPGCSLALRSADGAFHRRVDGAGGRITLSAAPGPTDATLTGTPSELLLTLWRRAAAAELTGDQAALAAWQRAVDG